MIMTDVYATAIVFSFEYKLYHVRAGNLKQYEIEVDCCFNDIQ